MNTPISDYSAPSSTPMPTGAKSSRTGSPRSPISGSSRSTGPRDREGRRLWRCSAEPPPPLIGEGVNTAAVSACYAPLPGPPPRGGRERSRLQPIAALFLVRRQKRRGHCPRHFLTLRECFRVELFDQRA